MNMAKRPKFCIEKECKPLCNMMDQGDEDYIGKGGSGACVGILKKPVTFVYKETTHTNNMSHCIFTPLKGMIRYQINVDDAWRIYLLMAMLMDKEKPFVCDECGPKTRKFGETIIVYKDKTRLCKLCALRLGKSEWLPDEKSYAPV